MKMATSLELESKMEVKLFSLNATAPASKQHYEVSPPIFYQVDYDGEVKSNKNSDATPK